MISLYAIFAIFGLCVGSFINVLICRMPKGKSVIFPPSHCPKCNNKLKFYHNIPLISYFGLGGKCAFCKCKISPIYPIIEASSAILACLALFIKTGNSSFVSVSLIISAGFLALCFILLLGLSVIDFKYSAVPEIPLVIAYFLALASMYKNANDFFSISSPLVISLTFMGGIFLIKTCVSAWKNRNRQNEIIESMGEADVIIFGIIGALCSFSLGLSAIIIACAIQIIFHLCLRGKSAEAPFVPALSVGILLSLIFRDFFNA